MQVSLAASPLRHWALISSLVLGVLGSACSSSGTKPASPGGVGGEGGSGEAGSGGSGGGAGTGGGGAGGHAGTAMPDAAPAPVDASDLPADAPTADLAAADVTMGGADLPMTSGPLALTSSVFAEGQVIAPMYRCMHENVSPPLAWTPGPKGTQSYAMILSHATTALHWVLWDIAAATTSLPMGVERQPMPAAPAGSKQAKPNLDGATWFGYTGPCPHSPSHYEFTIYALDVATLPGVTPQSTTKQVETAILAHKLASAVLSGTAAP
jgi:Raf kinase inhibitor-like YbhB/YbcL family protein